MLTHIASVIERATIAPLPLSPVTSRLASDGLYACHGTGRSSVYSVLHNQSDLALPVAAVIPIDAYSADRLAAVGRLWRTAQGFAASDTRLSDQRRKRLCLMIRATDGHSAHASRRHIAEVLFGTDRVAAELWAESSLRYMTIRLINDGLAMIDHGYRDLLRHRRRG
ncbi:DUF2285 domain-containing protein [Rhodophyticola porphyridii]|uniref:DUF2285 domain-containing protein n=1 Tax=Rhodophyticola porphyridii TaxID=1852017 RepID=UPI0035CFDD91